MAQNSNIEWTDATWNPIRGCTRVSEGCRNCYAERVAIRFSGAGQAYEGLARITNGHPQWTGKVTFVEKHLHDPLKWKEPRRIFVNSMSDLFHEGVSDDWIEQIIFVIDKCPQHTFQVLTKRPERMLDWFRRQWTIHGSPAKPLPNLWLGVSCENQATADERIPLLLQTTAAVRWVSAEPLLGPINFLQVIHPTAGAANILTGLYKGGDGNNYCTERIINWIVVGGESGPGARPMQEEWARSLMQQCKAAGVAFFMKQGSKANWPDFKNFASFPKDLQVREYPEVHEVRCGH